MIYEYMLERRPEGLSTPDWVEDGGYFPKDDNTMVGYSPDAREYYIPDSVVTLDRTALIARLTLLGHRDVTGVELTALEIEALVDSWMAARNG